MAGNLIGPAGKVRLDGLIAVRSILGWSMPAQENVFNTTLQQHHFKSIYLNSGIDTSVLSNFCIIGIAIFV
ncbi:MAG: hypothetical protein ABIX01_03405 [Chitinophagaceae bacterium]